MLRELVETLRPTGERLNCLPHLQSVLRLADGPSWSQRQLDIFHATDDPREVVRQMTDASRVVG